MSYKVVRGDREVKMSASQKALVASRSLPVQVNYCERSLEEKFGVMPEEAVSDVIAYAGGHLMDALDRFYGPQHGIVFDDSRIDIIPEPPSRSMTWGELPKGTTIVFWPRGDSPLNARYKSALQEQLLSESAGRKNPSMPSNDASVDRLLKEIAEMKGELGRVNGKYDKVYGQWTEQKQINSTLASKLSEQASKLSEQASKLSEQTSKLSEHTRSIDSLKTTVRRMQNPLRWLLYRYLLDSVRALVAQKLGCKSWYDIDEGTRGAKASAVLEDMKTQSPVRAKIRSPASEISSFITDDRSYVRQQGNAAAHTGDREDIREAIRMMPPEQKIRRLLSECYMILFSIDDIDA